MEATTWQIIARQLDTYADSKWIAPRLKEWREEDNWSYQDLADALKTVGPMSKSRLWKIEHPEKASGGGGLSIADVTALARVFNRSLIQMLLPPNMLRDAAAFDALATATNALQSVAESFTTYYAAIRDLRAYLAERPEWNEFVQVEKVAALARARERYDKHPRDTVMPSFEDWLTASPPIPELIAVDDVLGEHEIQAHAWAHYALHPENAEMSGQMIPPASTIRERAARPTRTTTTKKTGGTQNVR